MTVAALMELALFVGKEAPDVFAFVHGLISNGQDKPTQQQMDEFNQSRRDRGLEDVRWDNFITG